jgi:hypothetical protein
LYTSTKSDGSEKKDEGVRVMKSSNVILLSAVYFHRYIPSRLEVCIVSEFGLVVSLSKKYKKYVLARS